MEAKDPEFTLEAIDYTLITKIGGTAREYSANTGRGQQHDDRFGYIR